MVNLGYTFSLMTRFMVTSSLLFILVSCFLKRSNALEGRKDTAIESHYHTVEISSLLPASVCSPSTTKGSNKKSTILEVFHRHGPCSHHGENKAATTPSLIEVLSHDQSRVESIQARINPNSNTNKIKNTKTNSNKLKGKKANLQLQSGVSLGSGNYIVTIGLGTPKRTLSLAFDTGSDLTWTQCEPCVESCYQQQDPIFNPTASSTYSNVSCNSAECSELTAATFNSLDCAANTCVYGIRYGDRSFSVGFFSKDKLTMTATDVFTNFLFGCGQHNRILPGRRIAGILGFGRNPLSITSQTAQKYGNYFSYCLPSTSSSRGHLTLGKSGVPRSVRFTPFDTSKDTPFYFIDIISISVGGRQLPISQSVFRTAGSVIDSGTVITRLPPAAYSAMSAAFQKLMTEYTSAPHNSLLDTCYDLSGYTTVTIPTISFTFSGNVKLDLDPSGILIGLSGSRVCLAFAANRDASNVGIFGNTQQKTFEVVYDVAGGNIGFAPGGCK